MTVSEVRLPGRCPACEGVLYVTRLRCERCGSEVAGAFSMRRLATLPEPHASLLELFLRVRGNVKEMEREMGLSYPTVRARLEEALTAAGLEREASHEEAARELEAREREMAVRRSAILTELEDELITASEAAARLRELKSCS